MAERRAIPGWDGYFVDDEGRVFSHVVRGPGRRIDPSKERELVPVVRRGYLAVCLSGHGRQSTKSVHSLVALAFHGPRPLGAHARHLDGNSSNNRAANVAYGTPAENEADKARHGRVARGERQGSSALTEAQVLAIRELLQSGAKQAAVAKAVGVSRGTIGFIRRGQTWGHVEESA